MKIPVRIRALLIWNKIFYSKPKADSLVKISSGGKGVKSVVFLLPSEKKLAQVVSHFIKKSLNQDAIDVKFIVHENASYHYQTILKSDIITFSDTDLNWFGILDFDKILKKVSDFNYNALVDLNRSIEQPLSLLCMRLDIPIRVGFSSPISNYLYTVVIDPSENSFLEDNYITIEKILGLDQ
tara:strand:- start:1747 stop:2292 length:546 start_codon:yes stop_codon:yes gene_type:complete